MGNMKNKAHAPKRRLKRLGIVLVSAVILVGVLYFARGWLRKSVAPWVVQTTEAKSIQKEAQEELTTLGDPFKSLGYKNIETSPVACSLAYASGFTTEVFCGYKVHAYGELSQADADKMSTNLASSTIQSVLQSDGWNGEFTDTTEYTSLHELVTNLNKGIDYTPDASYWKAIGNTSCSLSSTTAFSSPKPAAMNTEFYCGKLYKMYGIIF